MKIDDDGLKTLYRGYVDSQTPVSRDDCPSAEQLVQALRGTGPKKERARVVDHVSRCGECAREFEFGLETVRAESTLIREIGGQDEPEPTGRRRPFYLGLSWGLASLLVAVCAAGVLFWKLAISPARETYRANARTRLELIQPGQDPVRLASLVFRWQPVSDVKYYVVEIYDEALAPLWKSEPVVGNLAALAESLKERLVSGRKYFWMVSAHFAQGDALPSPLREFSLKD